ncbi:MAG: NADPH:quinone oxidoreductase family protein [Blastomonas sp.]
MPKAVIAKELGPVENYRLEEHDPGPLKPAQVRIAIAAAGVSFVDVLTAGGNYQIKPPVPYIPGSECAGVIEAVGEEVTGLTPGMRVQAGNWGGMFADAANVLASNVRPIPDAMPFDEAAVFHVSYATAWHALVDRGRLQVGETLLVMGAGGATGFAAVQIGKHLGARVIASASSPAKRDLALAGGADAAVDARGDDWREAVRAANDGNPVDMVFDPVGGPATDPAFRSLAWNGRHLIIGFPAGIAALRTNLPLLKGAALIGVDIRQFGLYEPEKAAANVRTIYDLAGQGILKPVIAVRFKLADFAEAMTAASGGSLAGRVVLEMH